jgi:hypothetical protein
VGFFIIDFNDYKEDMGLAATAISFSAFLGNFD